MDFHLCKEEKFVYGHNIKALVHTCDILYVSILQSVFLSRYFTFTFAKCFPWSIFYFYFYFCQVFSLVGLFTPDARDPGRNCDVNQDLNNLSTNIDFDHFEKGNIFCEFYLRENVKYCLPYFLRQRGALPPLAKI